MSKSFLYILFFVSFSCFGQEFKDVPINTGVNMTVAIMDVDSGIVVGDTILALYQFEDSFRVGGLTIWKGERLAIAIWGDDSTSDEKDGFLDEESIRWVHNKNNKQSELLPIYRIGQNKWKPNGITIIEKLHIVK